ncbi:hypothetical protein DL95DRAFT_302714 [Leptodontidium sp. 2 PMI_412]|nr:hypothetical protein DL95DRAFT_302714 [Leptodontidium sp. 2 PMI_412]
MVYISSLKSITLVGSLFSSPALAQLPLRSLWGSGISGLIDPSLYQHLVPTQSNWDQWGNGWIPQLCLDAIRGENLSPWDVEVFNVHYTDCSQAWTFCRHRGASLSQIDMIDLFGRLPVHERQWVVNIVAVPGANSAYWNGALALFRGSVGVPSVFQHEIGHALDQYNHGSPTVSTRWEWSDAVRQDSCVPDDYSNIGLGEDFAQIGVVAMFERVNPGGLDPAFGQTWHCLINQLTVYRAFQDNAMGQGGVCDRRWADSETVPMGNAKLDPATKPEPNVVFGIPGVSNDTTTKVMIETVYSGELFVNETERKRAVKRQEGWMEESKRTRNEKRAGRMRL